MKKLFVLLMIVAATVVPVFAQDQTTAQAGQQPTSEEVEKAKAEREKNAYRLLDQVIDEAQSLRMAENRVRVQIVAGDLLWNNNQARARALFAMAADGVAELNRTPQTNNRRGAPQNNNRRAFQLRQELVLAAARHDAQLAYQLLASTKPPVHTTMVTDARGARFQPNALNAEDSLEQILLGRIASLDPKLAAQNAEQLMDKGQFPRTLPEVINQLHKQDPEAATKLTDKTVKKLQSANLLTNNEAAFLVQQFLMAGPRLPESAPGATSTYSGRPSILDQGAYMELLGTIVDLALKATPAMTPARRQGQPAMRSGVTTGGPTSGPRQPTQAQMEQNGANRFLASLQTALPLIDQYLPARSAVVRQKLAEGGLPTNSPLNVQYRALQGNATSDALIQAAATAPPQMQPRLYQQAAYKALEEGNPDRARQIATEHLSDKAREILIQQVNFREMAQKDGGQLDEIRQTIARLQTDDEKINLIVQLASDAEKVNPKLAAQLLEDAKQMTSRRATSYDHFSQQLRVARAFATLDPARSFEVLDPGISQLNELLAAAVVLNGFEMNMFRDGEMMLQGESGLGSMINRFGQELAVLARSDFERSETLAGRFQFAEPRIMTRLAIVQGLLDARQSTITPNRINVFRN